MRLLHQNLHQNLMQSQGESSQSHDQLPANPAGSVSVSVPRVDISNVPAPSFRLP